MLGGDWDMLGPLLASLPTLKFITLGRVSAEAAVLLLKGIKGIKHFQV